ncbi:MAG: magnesium transporter [Gemmatimonadaceae bacterium]|nr:magnesium transporter [Gemmatimonadaceae bacterium]
MSPYQHNPEERPIGALLAPDIIALLEESPELIAAETAELHPADLADVAEAMPEERIAAFFAALPRDRAADVLEYLDEELRTTLLEEMTREQAAALVTEMSPDDRADILDELSEEIADEIVEEMAPDARRETVALREYDPDTAGGLMTTEFVRVPGTTTVERALEEVRQIARSPKREAMHAVYVTDEEQRISGVLSLRELLAAPEGQLLSEAAWSEVRSVRPDDDRETVARMAQEYDLVILPVVSESGHLMGVITVDDVIDAIQEEQTEDVQKFGGMEALDEPYMQIGFVQMLKKRGGWLSILLVSEMFTTVAMQHFDGELKKVFALTLFVPLVMSAGGNSGSQATSLITRAMALREVTLRDWWRVALRELPTGLALGAMLGAIGMARIAIWQSLGLFSYDPHWQLIAITIGISLVGIVTFGSLAGSMLPFILRRFGFDPASASAPFVATLVDVTGLVIYFTVALLVLGGTLL